MVRQKQVKAVFLSAALCLTASFLLLASSIPETAFASGPSSFPFGPPAYDSGWITLSAESCTVLNHQVGGDVDDYVLDLMRRFSPLGDLNSGYGEDQWNTATERGIYWYGLTTSYVYVCSAEPDSIQVRLRIWVAPQADYDSGWTTPSQPWTIFTHNLGGNVDDYWVYMEFKDDGGWGINHIHYGRDRYDLNGDLIDRGIYWTNLNGDSITLYKGPDTLYADQVRVRIWRMPEPAYDSGWVDVSTGDTTLEHNLGGPWNDFFVDMWFMSKPSSYVRIIHQAGYGRDCYYENTSFTCEGAYWHSLTGSRIKIWRGLQDNTVDSIRVRIWASREPKYDSGWLDIGTDEKLTLDHNLGGDPDAYVVDMVMRSTGGPPHHLSYGADYWSTGSTVDMEGASWSNLTDSSITLYRFAGDTWSSQVRARLWLAPFPDYDSGWRDIDPGSILTLDHNLDPDSVEDYVVSLTFKDTDTDGLGVHHFWYGGDRYEVNGTLNEWGAYWFLSATQIYVYRGTDDTGADQVRVRIWKNSTADYNSGRIPINKGQSLEFDHNLGANPDDMVVYLQFDSGIFLHHGAYGGDYYQGKYEGAYWSALKSTSVRVQRLYQDSGVVNVRLRIWLVEPYRVYLPLVVRGP